MTEAMTMNVGAFNSLAFDEMLAIEGGRNWVATIAGTICGAATVVAGGAALLAPEPTGLTKVGGWATIVAGVSGIVWAWS